MDFAPVVAEKEALRPAIENDTGVQARTEALRQALWSWWTTHAPRIAALPKRRNLNAIRAEVLESFVAALLGIGTLDRFKLSGVIATWWTDTLPDFKTLLENGFPGVVDGWVDAIADAVEDDDTAGPMFDPFAHKLVRHIMVDYLENIAEVRSEVSRLKSEREAFEQSNPAEDADEEELANWNYAKDLERQIRDLRAEHRDELKALAKLEKAANKLRATDADRRAAAAAQASLSPVLGSIAEIEAALAPYERIKAELGEARRRYRELVNRFVEELRTRCGGMTEGAQGVLVLRLFAGDVQSSLEAAVDEKRQTLVRLVERLWDKYQVTLNDLQDQRARSQLSVSRIWSILNYV